MNQMKYRSCQKCSALFPNWITINGKKWNLRSRIFCLTCSPLGTHNTRDLNSGDYGTKLIDGVKQKRCRKCNEIKPFDQFYSKSEWGRWFASCKKCSRKNSKIRRREFKQWCVNYKGGKCLNCGYNRCLRSMDFHHLDESEKDYDISSKWKISKEKAIKELDKCVLVCRNCHGEIHDGMTSLP